MTVIVVLLYLVIGVGCGVIRLSALAVGLIAMVPAVVGAYAATKPGITGLWQVTGRSDCTYDERVSLDVAYVENWSILRDVWIIAKTVIVVFGRKGSY